MSSVLRKDPTLERHFRGHRDGVNCVDFNPNMKQLASGGLDNSVMLWNFKKNLRAFRFVAHKDSVTSVAFSHTGDLLASASKDNTVRLWIPNIEGKSSVVRQHIGPVRSVNFSPDDQTLLTASDDKSVKLYALKTQRFVASMSEHVNWVRCAKFSHSGELIASGSDDRTIKLWDPDSKSSFYTFAEQPGAVLSLDFHPSDMLLAAAAADHVCIYDMRMRKLLQFYECDMKTVRSLAFHNSGRYVLTGSDDSMVRILDIYNGRLYYTVHGHSSQVNGVCFSPDGEYFSTAASDRLVTVWKSNLETDELSLEDSGIFQERRFQQYDDFKEIDASMILANDDDFEVTDVHVRSKSDVASDASQDPTIQAIQGLVRQVEILTQTVQVIEKRLELLENKFEEKNRYESSLNETLNGIQNL